MQDDVTNEKANRKADLTLPLPSEEWDFRTIPKGQLEYAIFYEYARESDWILERFKNWHKIKLHFPDSDFDLRLWHGLTVGEALEKSKTREAPQEVHDFIARSGPEGEDVIPKLELLALLNNLFPVPFLKSDRIAERVLDAKEWLPLSTAAPPFLEISRARAGKFFQRYPGEDPWNDPNEVARRRKIGICKFEIVLDLRYSKQRLKDRFEKWLDGLNDKDIKKFPIPKGKAATPDWVHLKELAAYRLSNKADLTHKEAQAFLTRYIESTTSVRHGDVLPIYSKGGWSGAAKAAEARILKLFPPLLLKELKVRQ